MLLVLLTDVLFLSLVSDDVVAGVGASLPFVYTSVAIIGVFSGLGTSLVGRALGGGDIVRAKSTFRAALLLGVASGGVLMLMQIGVAPHFGTLLGLNEVAQEASRDYLIYLSPMLLLDGVSLNLTAYIFAQGKPKASVYASLALVISNIVGNMVLAFGVFPGIGLGAKEIALSTVFSQFPPILVMGYIIWKIHRSELSSLYAFSLEDLPSIRSMLALGLPSCLLPISANIVGLVFMSYLARIDTLAVTAYVYCTNLLIIVGMAATVSLAVSNQVFVSHFQGKKKFYAAKLRTRKTIRMYLPLLILFLLAFNLFSEDVIGLFTQSAEVSRFAALIFLVLLIQEPLKSINMIVVPALRGSGDVKVPTYVMVVSQWVFTVVVGWFFGFYLGFGLPGVLISALAGELVRASFNGYRWEQGLWINYLGHK